MLHVFVLMSIRSWYRVDLATSLAMENPAKRCRSALTAITQSWGRCYNHILYGGRRESDVSHHDRIKAPFSLFLPLHRNQLASLVACLWSPTFNLSMIGLSGSKLVHVSFAPCRHKTMDSISCQSCIPEQDVRKAQQNVNDSNVQACC